MAKKIVVYVWVMALSFCSLCFDASAQNKQRDREINRLNQEVNVLKKKMAEPVCQLTTCGVI